jgi:hypothetical protein
MTESDGYDVICDEVRKRGISSPFNNHSYKGTLILLPCVCSSCQEMIYPLITQAVICLRCHLVTHRGMCMRSTKTYCCKVDRQCDGTILAEGKSLTISEEKLILHKTQDKDVFHEKDSNFEELRVEKSIFDTLLPIIEATLIPTPGSINCIWRIKLQAIADQHVDGIKPRQPRNSKIKDNQVDIASDLVISSMLSDLSSFAGLTYYYLVNLTSSINIESVVDNFVWLNFLSIIILLNR